MLQPVRRRRRERVCGGGSVLRCTRTWQDVRLFDYNEHKIERTATIASSSRYSDTHSRQLERLPTNRLLVCPQFHMSALKTRVRISQDI